MIFFNHLQLSKLTEKMRIKNTTLAIILLVSIPLFSQQNSENKGIFMKENNRSYLDSIKKSFVKDAMASCVDSLWMKELTDLDLYNDITALIYIGIYF